MSYCEFCSEAIPLGSCSCPHCGKPIFDKDSICRTATFHALEVILTRVCAEVSVEVGTGPEVSVRVIGSSKAHSYVSGLSMDVYGTTLKISPGLSCTRSSLGTQVNIVLTLPSRTAVTLCNVQGVVSVGDTYGPLDLLLSGNVQVQAGCVGKTKVEVRGDSFVTIAEVKGGQLWARAFQRSRVVVTSGKVSSFHADARENAQIRFMGIAEEAIMMAYNTGKIRLARCLGVAHTMGNSRVIEN